VESEDGATRAGGEFGQVIVMAARPARVDPPPSAPAIQWEGLVDLMTLGQQALLHSANGIAAATEASRRLDWRARRMRPSCNGRGGEGEVRGANQGDDWRFGERRLSTAGR